MTVASIRRCVDEIRAFVNSPDQTNDPRIAARGAEYSQTCRMANERLQRCADALERGHRPEAIMIAEAEPDLLEVASILNFPELPEWQEIAGNYGWERVPPLKLDVAARVSDAYVVEKQLAPLMKQHRRLALTRGLLRERLAVLRHIALVDPTTPMWRDDIATFEQQRMSELRDFGKYAASTHDRPTMETFLLEYEGEIWSSPVSRDLQEMYARVLVDHCATTGLPMLASQVAQALATLNSPKLDELLKRWDATVSKIVKACPSWRPSQQLLAVIGPAVEYQRQQQQQVQYATFTRDVQLLQDAMQGEESAEKVDYLLASAESHGYRLPPMVQAGLANYRANAKESKYMGVATIVALAVGGIVLLVFAFFMIKASYK